MEWKSENILWKVTKKRKKDFKTSNLTLLDVSSLEFVIPSYSQMFLSKLWDSNFENVAGSDVKWNECLFWPLTLEKRGS
jgi:hypothetical protein